MEMKSTLTLIVGLPGVGKTTAAKILAQINGGAILDSDVSRRELFPTERTYSSQETGQIIQEVRKRTRKLLGQGKSVILDALFTKQRARDEYRKLTEELKINFQILEVVADEEKIKIRMDKRQREGDVSEANFAYYLDGKPHFELEEEGIVIKNSKGFEELERSIKKTIPSTTQ